MFSILILFLGLLQVIAGQVNIQNMLNLGLTNIFKQSRYNDGKNQVFQKRAVKNMS